MDPNDQNQGGDTSGGEPTATDQPITTPQGAPEPTPSAPDMGGSATPQESGDAAVGEKCVTCGNLASGGTCTACGQGEVTCSCTPASSDGGSSMGGPTGGEQPTGQPAV